MCTSVNSRNITKWKKWSNHSDVIHTNEPNENLCARMWSISCTDKFSPVFFDRLIVYLSILSKNFVFDLSAFKYASKHINSFDGWNFDPETENCSCANIRFQMRIAVFLFTCLIGCLPFIQQYFECYSSNSMRIVQASNWRIGVGTSDLFDTWCY